MSILLGHRNPSSYTALGWEKELRMMSPKMWDSVGVNPLPLQKILNASRFGGIIWKFQIVAKMCNQDFERLPVLCSSKSCACPSSHRKGKVTVEGQFLKRRGRNRILQRSLENVSFHGLDKRTVIHSGSGLQLSPHTPVNHRFQQHLLKKHQSWLLVTKDPFL